MEKRSADYRQRVVMYYRTHSLRQTLQHYHVSKSYLMKWTKRYDGTKTSLMDRPHGSRYDPKELGRLKDVLLQNNASNRSRNTLAEAYLVMYDECCGIYPGKRSMNALQKMARRLLPKGKDAAKRRKRTPASRPKKRNHPGALPGWRRNLNPGSIVEIDCKYFPTACIQERRQDRQLRLFQHAQATFNQFLREVTDPQSIHDAKSAYQTYVKEIEEDKVDAKPLRLYQYTAIDVATQYVVREVYSNLSEQSAADFLQCVVERLPFCVKRVKTDNGAAFRRDYRDNDPSLWTLFQLACKRYKIKHILNKPGSPWENAYVEGQHRLDQERFYATLIVHNEDEARDKLAAYDQRSLCYRKSNLNGRNPLEMVKMFRRMVKEAENGRL